MMFSRLRAWYRYTRRQPRSCLPPHVQAVKLNPALIALHMANAHMPSPRTHIGYLQPLVKEVEK